MMNRRSLLAGAAGSLRLRESNVVVPRSGERTEPVTLPSPRRTSGISLEECLWKRRSVREYRGTPLTKAEVGQIVWAAQGINSGERRTAPSAGALYPLEVYVAAGNVNELLPGIYKYRSEKHELRLTVEGDRRTALAAAALNQYFLAHASVIVVLAAVYRRTTTKYGQRGVRYVHIEAGHAAQNICLQAAALGLGCVPVGAFDDSRLRQLVPFGVEEEPLYLLPVGRI